MTDDNDKTVRSGGNTIPSEIESDATVRASGNIISSNTIPAGDDSDATVRAGGDLVGADTKSASIIPAALKESISEETDTFALNNKTFKLVKTISLNTGEASIYLIEDEKKEKFVLKLYKHGMKPKEDLLKKLRSFTHEDIIKVYDYGYFSERFFELMDFAAGGSVEDYMPIKDVKRIKQIVKETTNALKYCHKNGIIHRDIKPGNLFYKNADGTDIIIGDFGISSLLDDDLTMQLTGQARTPYFAAPELYQSIKEKVIVAREVDYYALGIALMFIWLGDNPFKGINEFALMGIKTEGRIPIPDDLPPELNKLIRGLTIVKKDKRWGADEVERWLRGEDVELIEQIIDTDYKPFLFDTEKNLIAKTPKDLAQLLIKYPSTGEKYLYRGKISKWLEDSKNQKLAVEIDDVTESIFKSDTTSGLYLAAYILDSDMPYTAVDGKECKGLKDFADAFENNFDEYKKNLKNKTDNFYLYLMSKGETKQGKKLLGFYKENSDEIALLNIIYSLDPERPFRFRHKKDQDGKTFTLIKTKEELAEALIDHEKEGMDYIYGGEISAWFRHKDDTNMYNWVEYFRKTYEKTDKDSGLMGLCFVLDKKMGYYAVDETTCRTKEEIAAALLNSFDVYTDRLKYPHTYLHMYFIAKRWDDVLDFTRYCFDTKKHKNKIGVYNEKIALMKLIRTLDKNIKFTFVDKTFSDPQELLKADAVMMKKIQEGVSDAGSKLSAWISVFYHEDPFTKEGYEDKLQEYTGFISQLAPKNPYTKRYNEAKNRLYKLIDKNKAIDKRFVIGLGIAALLPVLAALGVILYALNMSANPLPGAFWNVPFLYYMVVAGIFTVFTFIGMKEDGKIDYSTGCFGGPIAGLIGAAILYYIIYFVIGIKFIFIPLIAAGVGYVVFRIIKSTYSNKGIKSKIYDTSDKNAMIYEPLRYTYGKDAKFISSRENIITQYVSNRRKSKFTILKYSLLGTVALLALWEILLYYDEEYFTISEVIIGTIKSIF
ncbi:MAG: protein kinase [Ignavibacteriaceae bacterium]